MRTSRDLIAKAKSIKRKEKIKKLNSKVLKEKANKLNVYYIYARARRPICHEAENVVSALKWALANIPVQDVLEIHDEKYQLLWGRNTGLNEETFNNKHAKGT